MEVMLCGGVSAPNLIKFFSIFRHLQGLHFSSSINILVYTFFVLIILFSYSKKLDVEFLGQRENTQKICTYGQISQKIVMLTPLLMIWEKAYISAETL